MAEANERDYPWYIVVSSGVHLSQGDFLDGCPVLIPRMDRVQEGEELVGGYETYDVVTMSQSCDLLHGKVQLVLVCPVWDLRAFADRNPHYGTPKGKEQLRRGDVPSCHLLNRCELEGHKRDFRVVDFHNVYGIPFDYLAARTDAPRLRLLPPYREHLAQAFARFFMRVGLPVDIPPFR
jgi:hypothetical protein